MTNLYNIKSNLHKPILLMLFTFLASGSMLQSQTVFWSEGFETDGTGTRYIADNQFIDADGTSEDYFGRIQNNGGGNLALVLTGCNGNNTLDVTNSYSGQEGSFFMAGEDMNDAGGCGSPNSGTAVRSVEFLSANGNGIGIVGASTMTFTIKVANGADNVCGAASSRWDAGEGLKVFYKKDGSAEVTALCFAPNLECAGAGDTTNEPLNLDLDCDGDGEDGFVNNVFSDYSFTIPPGGSVLEIRVVITANAGDEEIAFDDLRLAAVTLPLPVELGAFDIKKKREDVQINWSTNSETNNEFFSVERSRNGSDFESIGETSGAGNSTSELNYEFMDERPYTGRNYYRIKQVDFDGHFSYSPIKSLMLSTSDAAINIFPNPTTDFITIERASDEDASYSIYNLNGKLMKLGVLQNKVINLIDLDQGAYWFEITENGKRSIHKIIKM